MLSRRKRCGQKIPFLHTAKWPVAQLPRHSSSGGAPQAQLKVGTTWIPDFLRDLKSSTALIKSWTFMRVDDGLFLLWNNHQLPFSLMTPHSFLVWVTAAIPDLLALSVSSGPQIKALRSTPVDWLLNVRFLLPQQLLKSCFDLRLSNSSAGYTKFPSCAHMSQKSMSLEMRIYFSVKTVLSMAIKFLPICLFQNMAGLHSLERTPYWEHDSNMNIHFLKGKLQKLKK